MRHGLGWVGCGGRVGASCHSLHLDIQHLFKTTTAESPGRGRAEPAQPLPERDESAAGALPGKAQGVPALHQQQPRHEQGREVRTLFQHLNDFDTHPFHSHTTTKPTIHTRREGFLRAARRSLGRTALCLSGGGSMAMYHLGVVRGLIEAGVFRYLKVRACVCSGDVDDRWTSMCV